MPTLADMLRTSDALEEKLASAQTVEVREALQHKKAMVDFAAFGAFKQANNFWPTAQKALGWGVGLGVPALGAGMLLEHNAKQNAEEVITHARNQALLAGLGLGGIALGTMAGRNVMASDQADDLRKLAAALLLDDVLIKQLGQVPDGEKRAVESCLLLNREHGTALLRKLMR